MPGGGQLAQAIAINMKLSNALQAVQETADEMNRLYQNVVFDEYALVRVTKSPQGYGYDLLGDLGPRQETFVSGLLRDGKHLQKLYDTVNHVPGDFEFCHRGVGTGLEAFVVVHPEVLLMCNNTRKSMTEISQDLRWLKAQAPFVELSERFRADPLELAAGETGA